MKRWERALLFFSLALNISFVSIAATHLVHQRDDGPPPEEFGSPAVLQRQGHPGEPGMVGRRFPALERWHAKRHRRFAERLQLDPAQQELWNSRFGALAPKIAEARLTIAAARNDYHQTLLHGDAAAIRGAARRVSQAQARLDSLCAEAMAAEAASLRPDQRARYVHWLTEPPRFPGRMRQERGADPTAAGRDANNDRKDVP